MPSSASVTNPFPQGEVQVSIEIEIEKIDTLEQTYFANLSFTLKYNDGDTERRVSERIEPWPSDEAEGNNVWFPRIACWNEFESSESELRINQALPNGVRIMRTSRSMFGNYFMQFDDFPFDEQSLEFCLMLDPGPKYVLKNVFVYDLETEFEIKGIEDRHIPRGRLGALSKNEGGVTVDMFKIHIQVKRHAKFYLLNFFSVTFALVLLQCMSIGVDIDDLSDRLQITLTLLLTLSAHKISVAGQVPKNTRQTVLDQQAMFAFLFLGASAVESLLISFEIAENSVMEVMDFWFTLAFAAMWILLNVYLLYYTDGRRGASHRRPFAYFGYGGLVERPSQKFYYRRAREDDKAGSRTLWIRTVDVEPSITADYATF